MRSRIRISCFALFILFNCTPFLSFAQNRPAPLPELDSLDFQQMSRVAVDLFGNAQGMEGELKQNESGLNEAQSASLEQYNLAKLDSNQTRQSLDSLSKIAKLAKDAYKKHSNQLAKAGKITQFTLTVVGMDSLNMHKNLPKAWKQVNQLFDELNPGKEVPKDTLNAEPVQPKKDKKKKEAKAIEDPGAPEETANPASKQPIPETGKPKNIASYNPDTDVMLHPPVPPCVVVSNSRDEFSGEISQVLGRAELFRYSNPALKAYLKGKTHVICEAALASTGPNSSLLLTFTINDPNARKAFGRLEKNSIANLKFMDEGVATLQNAVQDDGLYNPETGATIFHAQYPITPELLKKMRRTALDKIRIAWSNGYDDYEVQQVDLLMRQAECLSK